MNDADFKAQLKQQLPICCARMPRFAYLVYGMQAAVAQQMGAFQNDGTLWCEYPMYVQAFFVFDRIRTLAWPPSTPSGRPRSPLPQC
jgi:hypothetical protein